MTNELTEAENLTLEAVQEANNCLDANGVVEYVEKEHRQTWTKDKATRYLARLAKKGILVRLPRGSAGWGQGWHPSYYSTKS